MGKPALTSLPSMSDAMADADADSDGAPVAKDPAVQAAGLVREAIEGGDDEALADALRSFAGLQDSSPAAGRKPSLTVALGRKD